MWGYNSWQRIRRTPRKRPKPKPEEKAQALLKGKTTLNKYFETKEKKRRQRIKMDN